MHDRVELAAVEPAQQIGRRHEFDELAVREIAPFAVAAQHIVDGNPTNTQSCLDGGGNATGFLCYNDTVTPANGLNGQQLANPFASGATLGEIDRTTTQTTSPTGTRCATRHPR